MKKVIFIIPLLIVFMSQLYGQTQKIKEASILFDLPNKEWELKSTQSNNGTTAYFYKRTPIVDSANRSVIPNIAVIVESIPVSTNLIAYSAQKRVLVPFDVKDVFTYEKENTKINYENAIGYEGVYKDKSGLDHTVYVLHLINGKKGIQMIFDITSELFEKYKSEFLETIKSIRKK